MSELWPASVDPPDRVLVAGASWGPLIDRWMPTTHCFIHLVSWMDPTWARKEAHELVLLAAYLAHRDDAPDFWDVLRVVIVEYLSAGLPAYLDWLVEREESAHEVVAAMRRLPARDQVLLCLYDDDGRTSGHEEGRFRSADLALLFGIEPTSVRVAARTARQRLAAEREGRR
jgi:DNA-directed RNA polymerase specialized sigma24 family protein